ncbi:peptidase inhibitor family I36 protein [Sphaerisporangium sp. NPDC005289]|uniref:peptidase inhibitor family I36 protein n=1 Tax=Sphaerisporangium sp. NPDC005289 TaxID=3155247 RepID=UPI0033B306D1
MSLRRGARLVSLAVLAGAAALSFAPPAANAAAEDCKPGSICAYSGYNYTGKMVYLPPGGGCVAAPFPIASIRNTFGSPGIPAVAAVFAGAGCTGTLVGGVGQQSSLPVLWPNGLSVGLAW